MGAVYVALRMARVIANVRALGAIAMADQQELNCLNIARGDIGDALRFLDEAVKRDPRSIEKRNRSLRDPHKT